MSGAWQSKSGSASPRTSTRETPGTVARIPLIASDWHCTKTTPPILASTGA